ncbi:hypothetical protein PM3016_3609 [Paenibacillus mucilaginosus 3016]|uniref:Uncharacterized protein n=1 Tax=Paenibacillus mucilaginosus 3016 TaxID=1116391 RepID=H6NMU3_9BACL|nr:hypothetical protein PM3016_3609 [Paenibacillus mucilaginosus 3016]WFA19067.1 hypothetical protein ERY13_18210 [Paenibacillus mucilaginosus]
MIRREKRVGESGGQGTIEEEPYDVLYDGAALANVYDIDLETCFERKEEINRVKWNTLQD